MGPVPDHLQLRRVHLCTTAPLPEPGHHRDPASLGEERRGPSDVRPGDPVPLAVRAGWRSGRIRGRREGPWRCPRLRAARGRTMTRLDTRAMMAWLLWILALCPVLAIAQPKSWEDYMAAGQSAYQQGRYAEAGELFEAALKEAEGFGLQDQRLATSLNSLAVLYHVQGKYAEAEPLYKRALGIREKTLGPDHPDVASSLNSLAALYRAQGKYTEAEPLYQRALMIRERALEPDNPGTAMSLNGLALLYSAQRKYTEAEPLYQRALMMREKALGPDHRDVATSLNNLALLYYAQGKYVEAEPLYKRALAIREKGLGPRHPDVAESMENYAALLRKTNREAEAAQLEATARGIRAIHGVHNPVR